MLVGVPREIKTLEFRVGLTTASVSELVHHGHAVIVESGAGEGVGLTDAMYSAAGAEIVGSAAEVFERADMVVKVKEPQPEARSEELDSEVDRQRFRELKAGREWTGRGGEREREREIVEMGG